MEAVVAVGREFSEAVLERIRARVQEDPGLTRSALAREVCQWLNWKQPNGRWREASCRVALGRLEKRGWIEQPVSRRRTARRESVGARPCGELELCAPVGGSLQELGVVELVLVSEPRQARLWKEMVSTHHYCGSSRLVGAQVRYLIRGSCGWLGALGFSAAAWHAQDRDRFIGWSPRARTEHLQEVVANSRFLLLPWVRVPHLASKVLALASQRLASDWQSAYGYRPLLLETYVEQERFAATCYRAANWQCVGQTAGRGRQDRDRTACKPRKAIYVYPLVGDWQARLCCEPLRRPGPKVLRSESTDWATEEFGEARLGDRRLQRRLVILAQDFYARPQAQIPQACGSRARTKAAYRLLDHDQLTLPQLLSTHYASTVERLSEHAVVLAVQDTTSLSYSAHLDTTGLGPINTHQDGAQGLLVHDTLAFTVEGVPLGLLAAQVWVRPPESLGKKAALRTQLPIEQKESYKWLSSFHAAAAAQRELSDTQVVSVGDREADVYELFELAQSRADHPKLLVRAEQDRLVVEGHRHLWETVEAQEVAGYQLVRASRRRHRAARTAEVSVRFAEVHLRPPKSRRVQGGPVRVWAVLAREEQPPPGVEALEWLLLTTVPVHTGEQAAEKLRWYTQRWQIEIYHRTLKSGCRIEERQLAAAHRLENCLAIDMVIAWRIFHLARLGRQTPDVPCTVYFEEIEWQALYGFIHRSPIAPAEPPSLREAMRMVASLGGFLGRKGDGEPGTKSLWLGLQRLDDIAAAWAIFSSLPRPP